MERIEETAACKSLRLFLWNEKLTRDQISESEGLCVFIIRSTFTTLLPCESIGGFSMYDYSIDDKKCSTVIPFDLSKLRNREASLGSLLVSATLQFLPQTIEKLAGDISYCLFSNFNFQDTETLLPPPFPIIAVEISQTRCITLADKIDDVSPNFPGYPPDIPLYRRFEKEEGVFTIRNVNNSWDEYSEDILKYLDILRGYIGEGDILPTKPPMVVDVAKGFVEVKRFCGSWCPNPVDGLKDLTNETCPVCYEEFKDKNEVITTYCSHAFHIRCLLPWLSKNNACGICGAVYPLHYSPSLDYQRRKRKHNMLEAYV